MSVRVLVLGGPAFLAPDGGPDFDIFRIGTGESRQWDIKLPSGIYSAEMLVAKCRGAGFDPDLVFLVDQSVPAWVYGFERLSLPTVWFAIDTHLHESWHALYGVMFDQILCAQQRYVPLFRKHNSHGHIVHFPLYGPVRLPSMKPVPDRSAVFVGHLHHQTQRQRKEFFQELARSGHAVIKQGPWRSIYAKHAIVLNHSSHNEVNYRVFEALASGRLLITDHVPGLHDLFTQGEHLISFPRWDVEAAKGLIEHWLEDDKGRERIAVQGRSLLVRKHTADRRKTTWAKMLREAQLQKRVVQRLENLPAIHDVLARAYSRLAQHKGYGKTAHAVYQKLTREYGSRS